MNYLLREHTTVPPLGGGNLSRNWIDEEKMGRPRLPRLGTDDFNLLGNFEDAQQENGPGRDVI
ncbi:MAG: hypothetical protein CM15mP6_0480 [Methanobacteriota archaeon]|nr:MAG: hypothetical protein CM15mP6_0480 [Euryarchaeota archaeon]